MNRNPITDHELDELILQTFERQAVTDEIHADVMKQLRRAARHRRLRQWSRAVVFAFGLPLVLLLFGWLLFTYLPRFDEMSPLYLCLIIPVATMLYTAYRAVEHFSIEKM